MNVDRLALRYTGWLRRWVHVLAGLGVLVLAASVYLVATRLPLRADFAHLLPQDAQAVRDLRRLEARVTARDTVLAIVLAGSSEQRARAAAELAAGARAIAGDLVERVDQDDAETRAYLKEHRFLLVPLPDLIAARDALARFIQAHKLAANPLYVDLDDDRGSLDRDRARLDELRAQRAAAEARLARSSHASADGTIGLVVVRTRFPTTDAARGKELLAELAAVRSRVMARHPGVAIGFTGGVTTGVAEHDALVGGMLWSSAITAALVTLLLVAYLRSVVQVGLLVANLAIATVAAFAISVFTVGHLNAATGFLGAVIAGNGVNYGILVVARYREERTRAEPQLAMARTLARTVRPTLVASLGAAIAYGSLAATSFRGFADFAAIGSVGMLTCWIASFTLLPALVLRWAPGSTAAGSPGRAIGGVLARVFGALRPTTVLAIAAVLVTGATVVVVRYLASDPFEYNLKELRSTGGAATESRRWLALSDAVFGKSISGRIVIAADRRDQVPLIVAALQGIDAHLPPAQRVVGAVSSILDIIPADQPQRLAVLGELRALIDDPATAALSERDRAELRELRPPEDLRPVTFHDLPSALREAVVERDGRVGLLVAVRPGPKLDQWNGRDLIRLASAVRTLQLANGETVTTSGSSVIFADIVSTIERDGPRVTLIATTGLLLMVLVVAGRDRRALAVLAATACGTLAMVAICALIGIRVSFLDFVALPITLGLGVDYAVNVAHRAHAGSDPTAVLRTTGAAVLVCSLTTIIGYGSLLVSQNGAIRGFGLAALIGEVTCVIAALALVPAIVFARRNAHR